MLGIKVCSPTFCFDFVSFVLNRFGSKGKEAHLSCLVIYYFIIYLLFLSVVALVMLYFYSGSVLKQYIKDFTKEIADNLSLFLFDAKDTNSVFDTISKNPTAFFLVVGIVSLVLLAGLILCGYLIGINRFIKANLSFGSLFVVLIGTVVAVFSVIRRQSMDIGGSFTSFGWVIVGIGIFIALVGLGGCMCGLFPKLCSIPLHIYALVLLVIAGVLVVFGVVILIFPALLWETLYTSLVSGCYSNTTGSLFFLLFSFHSFSCSLSVGEKCNEDIAKYYETTCPSYSVESAPSKGPCSLADVIDHVAISNLDDIVATLEIVGAVGLAVSVVFIYVLTMIMIALNSNWEVCHCTFPPHFTFFIHPAVTWCSKSRSSCYQAEDFLKGYPFL